MKYTGTVGKYDCFRLIHWYYFTDFPFINLIVAVRILVNTCIKLFSSILSFFCAVLKISENSR